MMIVTRTKTRREEGKFRCTTETRNTWGGFKNLRNVRIFTMEEQSFFYD